MSPKFAGRGPLTSSPLKTHFGYERSKFASSASTGDICGRNCLLRALFASIAPRTPGMRFSEKNRWACKRVDTRISYIPHFPDDFLRFGT